MNENEMMDLLEQQQTELEEKDKTIAQLKTEIKNLTGEMQLMNEQIVKMSESDKELQRANSLKRESEKAIQEATRSRDSFNKYQNELIQEKSKVVEIRKELEEEKANTKSTIEKQTQERVKAKLKEDRDIAIAKNYSITFGLIYYSIAITLHDFYLSYTPYHLQQIKNFFLSIFEQIKKVVYDIPVMLWNIQLEIDNQYLSIALRVIFILVFLAIIILIMRFIIKKIKNNINYLHNKYYHSYYSQPQYRSEPLRVCIFVLLVEYMLLFSFAKYMPINYNYIFVILAVLSVFLINHRYLTNLD